MTNTHYYVTRGSIGDTTILDNDKLSGFDVTPKNRISYDGIIVNKLVIIKQSFIEYLLKKKIKRKLELYLQFLLDFIESDSTDGGTLDEVLDDLKRYKSILNYRYRKHLGESYIDSLIKKIEFLEHELKVKAYLMEEKQILYSENEIGEKSR